ncbi:MAG TPA: class I SAM-dependent methyltransferase [Rhodanobacteraceae bacterium]|nr:class I SAM-dependent methyltransferase [Rhodanobacteraceae bacterium]
MKDLFRRTPLQQFAEYSASHMHAGVAYQARFRDRPGRASMWALEERLIREIFTRLAPRRALDFATGTGRIVSVLEKHLPDCEFHGIDIANDMLDVARTHCARTTLHEMDGRQALSHFGKGTFDVVSAFRFFPNAEPPLREAAASQISGLTRPGGYVVLNNHRSFWSLPYMLMRACGNEDGSFGSPNADMRRLFLDKGFSCVRQYSLGVWPQTDFRSALLPWPVTNALERFNMRYSSRLHGLGYNTVFVFRKDGPDACE